MATKREEGVREEGGVEERDTRTKKNRKGLREKIIQTEKEKAFLKH